MDIHRACRAGARVGYFMLDTLPLVCRTACALAILIVLAASAQLPSGIWHVLAGPAPVLAACSFAVALLAHTVYRVLSARGINLEIEALVFAREFAAALMPPLSARAFERRVPLPTHSALVLQACRRAARTESQHLAAGLPVLVASATVIPLIGIWATCFAIFNSFVGMSGEKGAVLAALANNISNAIVPVPLTLALALPILWTHRALTARLASLKLEMDSLALALANALT